MKVYNKNRYIEMNLTKFNVNKFIFDQYIPSNSFPLK